MANVQSIKIVASAGNDDTPRANPDVAPEKRVDLGKRIPHTDQQPNSLWLALEGTDGNTVVVAVWWTPDDPHEVASGDQRWFLVHGNVTVTVGAVVRANAMPGYCAIQIATTSAADSTLFVLPGVQPVAVS